MMMALLQFFQALGCRSETTSIFELSFMKNRILMDCMIAAFFAQLAVLSLYPRFKLDIRDQADHHDGQARGPRRLRYHSDRRRARHQNAQ